MRTDKVVFATLGLVALASPAHAANRTIQFAGMATVFGSTSDFQNTVLTSLCSVFIMNMGSTTQVVKDITFFNVKGATSGSGTSTSFDSVYGTSSSTSSGCVDKDLSASGGFCLVQFAQTNIPWTGQSAICAGRITVQDKEATKPGSIVATGAISINQEWMVLGGMLSGAYYASGTHIYNTTAANIASKDTPSSNSAPAVTSYGSYNMNHYCYTACKAYVDKTSGNYTDENCQKHCGYVAGADMGWTGGITGTLDDSTSLGTNTYSPKYWTRTSNAHFAGGMVYEMIHGPMVSICSGNTVYFNQGGQDFHHSDGVDDHIVIKDNESTYPGAPPERLVCNHRHLKEELFARVGSTTPVIINGGQPF